MVFLQAMRSPEVDLRWVLATALASTIAASPVVACSNAVFTASPGSTTDAATPPDAGFEAGQLEASTEGDSTGADTAGRGCARHTELFCADFDQGRVTDLWDTSQVAGGGEVLADTAVARSVPRSFFARTPAVDGNGVTQSKARLVKSFSQSAATVHLAFEVFVDADSPNNARAEMASVALAQGPTSYTLYVDLRSGGDELIEYIPDAGTGSVLVAHPLSTQMKRGGWTHLQLDASLATKHATLSLDGVPAVTTSLTPPFASATPVLYVGLTVSEVASEVHVHLDDVRFDLK